MVQASVADVVGPAVASEDPDALLDQHVRHREQVLGFGGLHAGEFGLQGLHALPLGGDARLVLLVRVADGVGEVASQGAGHLGDEFQGVLLVLVDGQAEAQPELGRVLEERIGPRGAAAVAVDGPGGGGKVAAVDGRAARGVGDDGAISEELAQELDVGRLAASRAGARVLEEGLEELRALDRVDLDRGPVHLGQVEEELVVVALGGAERHLVGHVQGLVLDVALVLGGADPGAGGAARAVLGGNLDGVLHPLELLALEVDGLEGGRGVLEERGVVDLDADGGVGAGQGALSALDADLLVPDGDLQGDVALLPLGRGRGEGPVHGHGRNGKVVALVGDDLRQGRLHELRRLVGNHGGLVEGAGGGGGDDDLVEVRQRHVHGLEILLDDLLALGAVGLLDGLLDGGDGLFLGEDARDGEEAGLHDGVHAAAHARVARHGVAVDDVEAGLLGDELLLDGVGQLVPDLLGAVGAVEEEDAAGHERAEHVVLFEEDEGVAGQEVGGGDEVGGADGPGPEPEVGDGDGARFLGIVDEVALGEVLGLVADDLDGVLVGAHRPVGAEAVEEAPDDVAALGDEGGIVGEAVARDVILDAHREVVLGLFLGEFVQHRLHHGGRELLGGEAVAAADDLGEGEGQGARSLGLAQDRQDVLIEGLARGAGFLGAVQDGQSLGGLGQGGEEGRSVEGAVEADLEDAHLLSLGGEVLDGLVGRLGARAHEHHHALGLGVADVIEEMVLAPHHRGELVHGLLHDRGEALVEGVGSLAGLEEDVGVLCGPADDGVVGRQGPGAVGADQVVVDHGRHVLPRQLLDLLHLVRGPEPVEVVEHGHPALQGRGLGDEGEVHDLLQRARAQVGPSRGAGGHDVAVVAEDGQRMGGHRPGRHVKDGGGQLAGDLEHVGDHEQEALGGGEGGGEGPGLKGSVHGTRRSALALELHHRGDRAPDVGPGLGGPLIRPLSHGGGGGDGIDGAHLVDLVGHEGCRLVSVDGNFGPGHMSFSVR